MFGKYTARDYINKVTQLACANQSANITLTQNNEHSICEKLLNEANADFRGWLDIIVKKEWEQLHQNVPNALEWSKLPAFVRMDFKAIVKAKLNEEMKGT